MKSAVKTVTDPNAWSPTDEKHSLNQGWGLFRVDSGGVVIQKMDEPAEHGLWEDGMIDKCPFESDGAAIRFVRRQARQGDTTARKALLIHDQHYPTWKRYRRGG